MIIFQDLFLKGVGGWGPDLYLTNSKGIHFLFFHSSLCFPRRERERDQATSSCQCELTLHWPDSLDIHFPPISFLSNKDFVVLGTNIGLFFKKLNTKFWNENCNPTLCKLICITTPYCFYKHRDGSKIHQRCKLKDNLCGLACVMESRHSPCHHAPVIPLSPNRNPLRRCFGPHLRRSERLDQFSKVTSY